MPRRSVARPRSPEERQLPPVKFARARESKRYLSEIDDFIANEITHADRQVRTFERGDHTDTRFANSARRYVSALRQVFDSARRRRNKGLRREFLAHFPDIIRDLTTAIYQRIEREPSRAFTLTAPRAQFVPSEVTLEYPVTIRSAEAINDYYHERVRGFLPKGSVPPLVNLSGGTVAMLHDRQGLAREATRTAKLDVLFSERRLGRLLRIMDDLSSITLPRWSSQHIRTYALAAHEHMHRALNVALYINQRSEQLRNRDRHKKKDVVWAIALGPVPTLGPADEVDRHYSYANNLERPLGAAVVELAAIAFSFLNRLWGFYRKRELRPNAGTVDEPVRSLARAHAQELLADIGALLIAGPAFAFAFRTVYSPVDDLDHYFKVDATPSKHPPASLRARVHIDVLRELGFVDIATLLEEDFIEWNTASTARNGFLDEYAHFLRDGAGSIEVLRAIDLFGHVAGDKKCYDLKKRAGAAAPYHTQAALQSRWVDIAREIEEEGAILPSDVRSMSPSDVINAIWWKRIQDSKREPLNRMAWRVALRNHQAATRGARVT